MPFLAPIIASITTFLTTTAMALGFSATAAAAIASSLIQMGASLLLNAAAAALFGKKPKAQDVARELAQQTTGPAYRFVYSEGRATGTPAGIPVKGKYIYGCWILNSRVSYLPSFTLYLDKREVVLTGDAFDLEGSGATPTEEPFLNHVQVWMARGDHTAPPAVFTDEAPWVEGSADHLWKETDIWKGRTVIWMKIHAGDAGQRNERWPASPPLVEVEGKWSLIYDPREVAHDPDDPETWEWSENHALCVRDVLRQNPIRPYQEGQLHSSFSDGADVCDETVDLKSGGTEARYICAGTVVFSEGEIEDQVNPMVISGAASLIRVGGQLGYAPGEYRAPTVTLDYLLGDGFEFPDLLPGDQLVNELRVSYLSPARGYETAELQPWPIPGALAEDGGVPTVKTLDLPFCPSATQAMRVRKITGLRQRRQERISGGSLPPEAFDLIGGATAALALPAPYDALDGVYEIESIHPGADPVGASGEVALRMPAVLVKHSASIYAWNKDVDEEVVFDEVYDGSRDGVALPGVITVSSGAGVDLNTGGSIIPRFKFKWQPSSSESALSYEWEWRLDGDEWQSGGSVDADVRDGLGRVFFHLLVAEVATPHDVRVRTIGETGRSGWRELTGAIYNFEITGAAGSGGLGTATFTGTAPDSEALLGLRVYYGAVGSDFDDATRDVNGITEVEPGAAFSIFAGDEVAVNLVTNGEFATDSDWTKGTGWTISAGKLTHAAGTASSADQDQGDMVSPGIEVGEDYRFVATVSGRTAGHVFARLSGSTHNYGVSRSANGTVSEVIVGPASPDRAGFSAHATFDGSVDDVIIYKQSYLHLPIGQMDFWVVPVTLTRTEGLPVGPFTLTIL